MSEAAIVVAKGRRPRRAGRGRDDILAAAGRVVAERGVDQARFADVSAAAGVPVSTLQYSFGSREDLLLATFEHVWRTEREALADQCAAAGSPWDRLRIVVEAGLQGFAGEDVRGRLWLESIRLGIRDPEARRDVLADYQSWRGLVADAVADGMRNGDFRPVLPEADLPIAVLALIDGTGSALALADPHLTGSRSVDLVLGAVSALVGRGSAP
jgi:AcrR family transcriptional regulator